MKCGRGQTSNATSITSRRKNNVMFLCDEWKSSKGGLSTFNREFAVKLAKTAKDSINVHCYVSQSDELSREDARQHGVNLITARSIPGSTDPLDWLKIPPPELSNPDIVIGHGRKFGTPAYFIVQAAKCKWVHFVHVFCEDLGKYKVTQSASLDTIEESEKKHKSEIELCKAADLVVAVGSRLQRKYSKSLPSVKVEIITPGIIEKFSYEPSQLVKDTSVVKKFNVFMFGRASFEDLTLKGYDIIANAIGSLDKMFELTFVGSSSGEHRKIEQWFLHNTSISRNQITIRSYCSEHDELKRMFHESDMVALPSRTEGFGLVALEAISAGIPVLVAGESGIAEALQEVEGGMSLVVESDDASEWAQRIQQLSKQSPEERQNNAKILRENYNKTYSWSNECEKFKRMSQELVESLNEFRMKQAVVQEASSAESLEHSVVQALSPKTKRKFFSYTQEKQQAFIEGYTYLSKSCTLSLKPVEGKSSMTATPLLDTSKEATPLLRAVSSLEKEANEKGINAAGSLKRQFPSTAVPGSHHNKFRALVTASKTIPEQRNMSTVVLNQMSPIQSQLMTVDQQAQKLRDFFSKMTTRLASERKGVVAKTVNGLIQSVVEGRLTEEQFEANLQTTLNSPPQPNLVPYLKKTLPLLRAQEKDVSATGLLKNQMASTVFFRSHHNEVRASVAASKTSAKAAEKLQQSVMKTPPLLRAESSLEKEANKKGVNATGSLNKPMTSTTFPRSRHNEVRALVAASKTIPKQRNMPSIMPNQMITIQNQAVTADQQAQKLTSLRDFFRNLTRLASEEKPPDVVKTVKELVQGVVEGKLTAEQFAANLQTTLNRPPQPNLVPFLKKGLPMLRAQIRKEASEKDPSASGLLQNPMASTAIPRFHHNEVRASVTASKTSAMAVKELQQSVVDKRPTRWKQKRKEASGHKIVDQCSPSPSKARKTGDLEMSDSDSDSSNDDNESNSSGT